MAAQTTRPHSLPLSHSSRKIKRWHRTRRVKAAANPCSLHASTRRPLTHLVPCSEKERLTEWVLSAKKAYRDFFWNENIVSGVLSLAKPQRIKASHRRRWKGTTGHSVYIMNNPLSGTDPTGYQSYAEDRNMFASLSFGCAAFGTGCEALKATARAQKDCNVCSQRAIADGIAAGEAGSALVDTVKESLSDGKVTSGEVKVVAAAVLFTAVKVKTKGKSNGDDAQSTKPSNKDKVGKDGLTSPERIKKNSEKGESYANEQSGDLKKTQPNLQREITVKTESGVKTRLDCVGKCAETGDVKLTEIKSSSTAPLTSNQKAAHPEIEKSGATVVGKGKGDFPGGTKIAPTKVDVVRPCDKKDGC
jgi:hypothetical protein